MTNSKIIQILWISTTILLLTFGLFTLDYTTFAGEYGSGFAFGTNLTGILLFGLSLLVSLLYNVRFRKPKNDGSRTAR